MVGVTEHGLRAVDRLQAFVDVYPDDSQSPIKKVEIGAITIRLFANDIRVVLDELGRQSEEVGALNGEIASLLEAKNTEIARLKQEVTGLRCGDDYLSRVCSIVDEAAKPVLAENARLLEALEKIERHPCASDVCVRIAEQALKGGAS